MKKKLLFAALASIVLVGCTSNDFVGDTPPAPNGSTAIAFGGNAGKLTRATSNTGTIPEMLDNQIKIYGVKNVNSTFSTVFPNYILWSSTAVTTSNPDASSSDNGKHGWEYVGGTTQGYGTGTDKLTAEQTIKYWDYSATEYHFVAGSPVANFTYNLTSGGDITSATVEGLGGHINANPGTPGTTTYNPVYIADPVIKEKTDFNTEVEFNFRRQQSFVRVGIFETVPGYKITSITFYNQAGTKDTNHNIILTSGTADYFVGSASPGTSTATVSYTWEGPGAPYYSFAYDATGLSKAQNWYGGNLDLSDTNPLATTSTESTITYFYGTDKDMAANGFFTVIPTPTATAAAPIMIKCDYVLTAEDSGETITVTGATAAIPAAFCKWLPNVSYTYLFKISDNTNGSTGTPGTDPEGLFPITFDAVVEATTDAKEGTITTVSTPSITTYQEGSVTEQGIQYAANKPIYATVQNDETGTLITVGASVLKVFKLSGAKTEADLQLTAPTENEVDVTFPASATSLDNGNISLVEHQHFYFTPDANGYYAIQYQTAAAVGTPGDTGYTPAAYAYKVVKVGNE